METDPKATTLEVEKPDKPDTQPDKKEDKLFSQAELDRIVADRLARKEEADRKKSEAEKKQSDEAKLKEQNEWKSLAEKKEIELAETQKKLKERETLDLKRTTAAKHGIPENLAARLIGTTPEEIEADAKALAETLPKANAQKPSPGPTNPGDKGSPLEKTPEERGKEMLYSGNANWAGGGGVVMPE
jgi:hypothetical protein